MSLRPTTLNRPQRVPLLDGTIEALRTALLNGHIRPGERLDESELVREMEVSRSTIREAMRQLEQEGLLIRVPFKGIFARDIDPQELRQILALRNALEGFAAELIIQRNDPEDLRQLIATVDQMEQTPPDLDFEASLQIHLSFHQTLCRLSGNQFLYEAWSNLMLHIVRVIRLSQRFYSAHDRSRTLASAHRLVVEAMASGNLEHVRAVIGNHVLTPDVDELMKMLAE